MNDLPKYVSYEPDRHGNKRWYYRRGGQRVRLNGCPGAVIFSQALAEAHASYGQNGKPVKYVYFLRVGSRIKIGRTIDLRARLTSLKTAISRPTRLTYVIRGDVRIEQRLHDLFAEDHVRGEWFRYSAAIKAWIRADKEQRRHAGVALFSLTATGVVSPPKIKKENQHVST